MTYDDLPPLSPDMTPAMTPAMTTEMTTPIRTASDLHRRWTVLMGELGFAERALWWIVIGPDGVTDRVVGQVSDPPAEPSGLLVRNLLDGLAQAMSSSELARGSVAFLLSRPGSGDVSASDLSWARGLTCTATQARVRVQPSYLATDEGLCVFTPDDLPAPAR